jgi:hypothetical protein
MAQLNVTLNDEQVNRLRRYADERDTPIAKLIGDYLDYLLAGGEPVVRPATRAPTAAEMTLLAQHGGAFDWLAEEPDLYTEADGEPR